MTHKYHLQPYSGAPSRYRCPGCNHRTKTFTRYIDAGTGEHLAPHVGLCNRQDNCGYHFTPKQYFAAIGNYPVATVSRQIAPNHRQRTAQQPDYYISPDYVNSSFADYHRNNFYQYLIGRFGLDVAARLAQQYRIGTSGHWHGATVFWQLDADGYVRTGKIMLYDKQSGRRVKQPYNHITWAHTHILKQMDGGNGQQPANFVLNQCLFGEHLLIAGPYKPVAIVESEKTAIIAAALMPAFIWLASGSLEGLNPAKCKVLHGRKVMLFPDVNAYSKWKLKAMELQRALPGTTFRVSNELECLATAADRKKGVDLGDVAFV
ncbi:hypothetical protein IDJ75_07365 [Mucilaginibacter rigui]|uniref:Toprim domain-containing protein n=1 Tax=Mucilaginibacter rigui TaxID=534635 RepID=A0ABR7X3D0_9SPHI|nr:DUF6371 domain-containing protein [Mucilaginibacter rigui]MBD1385092.1 hypothetical protein [Mucilaginibacter rigui]